MLNFSPGAGDGQNNNLTAPVSRQKMPTEFVCRKASR